MLREENWQRDIRTYCLRRLGIFCWFPSRGVLFVKFVFKLLWLPKCVTTFQQTNRFTKSNSPPRKNADSWMNTIGAFISCSRSAHLWRERNEASISMARWGPDCSLLPWYRANSAPGQRSFSRTLSSAIAWTATLMAKKPSPLQADPSVWIPRCVLYLSILIG